MFFVLLISNDTSNLKTQELNFDQKGILLNFFP